MGKPGKKSKRGKGEIYDEAKSEQLSIRLTPTAKRLLKDKALKKGVSIQELIERYSREI
ncbi:hypothetical protein [Coleofasciculus sp. FACHB-1120]|uniref:hypothetical protein n=1 Tax=Coleofasciculus sp. FACHB-1120 TaxID=2692783 RepID=UPI00168586A5|nr:hypothetical protein [Coleofasciculus sp. FACHB-1120]MBD2743666.1 hypothetical protein [Coleofasciculus sp. FACHB-1120]